VCYPPHHRSLHNDILQRGMLLSENAPGTCVAKWRFPERNRIIAALAPTLIIVQAGDKSGALRTVDFALEIGRDVFVVPGPVTSMHFRGSNRLIQQGSQVLLDPHDLLETLSGLPTSARLSTVPARWQDLYDAIQEASVAAALVTQLGKSPSHIYAGLLELELAGLIIKRPGGLYERGGS
jgi:DNA processing protein